MTKKHFLHTIAALLMILCVGSLTACRAPECKVMMACCEQVKDVEGVGASCGALAESLREPTTCRSVVRTIHFMLEDRQVEIPEACNLK